MQMMINLNLARDFLLLKRVIVRENEYEKVRLRVFYDSFISAKLGLS